MKYKLTAVIVLVFLAVVFIVQNAAVVDIKVFFWTISISRILLMFILLIIGIVIGFLFNSYLRHPKKAV